MQTSRFSFALPGLALLLMFVSGLLGCGSSQDELTRAQQEIDTRQYSEAIERLERQGEEEPEIRQSERYIDLLTSAYLGKSGVDLIDALGHWAETYVAVEKAKAEAQANPLPARTETIRPLDRYKELVHRLIPPDLFNGGHEALRHALRLCNDRLAIYAREERPGSSRILVKTVFVNFWALLMELQSELIPTLERTLATPEFRQSCDNSFVRATRGFANVTLHAANIALAVTLLGDRKSAQIEKLSALTNSLKELDQLSLCGQPTHENVASIEQPFFTR